VSAACAIAAYDRCLERIALMNRTRGSTLQDRSLDSNPPYSVEPNWLAFREAANEADFSLVMNRFVAELWDYQHGDYECKLARHILATPLPSEAVPEFIFSKEN
jgi:hypothetical protein